MIGVVMICTLDQVERLGWNRSVEHLPSQFNRNNAVLAPVDEELGQGESRQPVDQSEFCSQEPMNRQYPVIELRNRLNGGKARFHYESGSRLACGQFSGNRRAQRPPEPDDPL